LAAESTAWDGVWDAERRKLDMDRNEKRCDNSVTNEGKKKKKKKTVEQTNPRILLGSICV